MSHLDQIADERRRLQKRLSELDIAERVLRSLEKEGAAEAPSRGRRRSPEGIPQQYADVLAILDAHGGSHDRAELLSEINSHRAMPMPQGTYAALLSKMAAAELIVRANGQVSRTQREIPV